MPTDYLWFGRDYVSDLIANTLDNFEGGGSNSELNLSNVEMIGQMLIAVDAGVGSAPHLMMSASEMLAAIAVALGSTSSNHLTESDEQLVADIVNTLSPGSADILTMSWRELWSVLETASAGGIGGDGGNLLWGSPDGLFWGVDRLVWNPP